jgi:homocysteine S-methyltransferase
MVSDRTRIIGGCCGTTPEHIAAICAAMKNRAAPSEKAAALPSSEATSGKTPAKNVILEKFKMGKKVIAVELDPPKAADSAAFMNGARRLQTAGVDALTIADCPIARASMDSSLLACKVKRELSLEVIPHMTCRDRNLNATKALLLGLFSEGIRNVLTVTGDPVPTAERNEVKIVYQFNSRKMARYIKNLGQTELPEPMQVFGALNLNARNFDIQMQIAKEKIDNGMIGFLTQPVLTSDAFDNLKRARAELHGWILGGILPVVSAKNARFMDSEINGINVSPELIRLYDGKDRGECERLALDVSLEIARRIEPYVDGYYLMTPFNRVHLMETLIQQLKSL